MACSDFFQPYIDWLSQDPQNFIRVQGVANRPDSRFCYYMVGILDRYSGGRLFANNTQEQARQYFSDRLKGDQPFDASQIDKLGLDILVTDDTLITYLLSFGGGKNIHTMECRSGLVLGTSSGDGTILVLSFTKEAIPIIP